LPDFWSPTSFQFLTSISNYQTHCEEKSLLSGKEQKIFPTATMPYSSHPNGQFFTINSNTPGQGIIAFNPARPYANGQFLNPNNTGVFYEGFKNRIDDTWRFAGGPNAGRGNPGSVCDICGRQFATQRGMLVHRHWQHIR